MGKTAIMKMMERACGHEVKVGDRVWCNIDWATARDFGGANVVLQFVEEMGEDAKVWDPDKVAFTFDLQAPTRSEKVAKNQQIIRDFAKKQGIKRVFDINNGIGQHVMLEAGMIKPGDVVLGTDSHMNLLGSVGAFATGVGNSDVAVAYINGINWFRVPETMKIVVDGKFKPGVYMRDFLLKLIGDLGASGMYFKAVEFYGEAIDNADLADRICLCSMATEMSAKIPIIMPSGKVLDWLVERAGDVVKERVAQLTADPDAEYCQVLHYDVSDLEPMVACPDSPDNVKPISEVEGEHLDQIHIGSCSNGRFEDIEAAWKVLKAAGFPKLPVGFRAIITPATTETQLKLTEAGYVADFLKCGVVCTNPTCALCTAEHYGTMPAGAVGMSTTNRNFIGKVGKGSHTYLASPAVAMASAINGCITDPRKYLK